MTTLYLRRPTATCPQCEGGVDALDRYCRTCGTALRRGRLPWGQRRGVVLILLFFILGPLELRQLWRSPAFSTNERVFFSVLSIAEFIFLTNYLVQFYLSYIMNIAGLDAM